MLKKTLIALAAVASVATIIPAQARDWDDGLSIRFETAPVRVYRSDWHEDRHEYRHYDRDYYHRYDRDYHAYYHRDRDDRYNHRWDRDHDGHHDYDGRRDRDWH